MLNQLFQLLSFIHSADAESTIPIIECNSFCRCWISYSNYWAYLILHVRNQPFQSLSYTHSACADSAITVINSFCRCGISYSNHCVKLILQMLNQLFQLLSWTHSTGAESAISIIQLNSFCMCWLGYSNHLVLLILQALNQTFQSLSLNDPAAILIIEFNLFYRSGNSYYNHWAQSFCRCGIRYSKLILRVRSQLFKSSSLIHS